MFTCREVVWLHFEVENLSTRSDSSSCKLYNSFLHLLWFDLIVPIAINRPFFAKFNVWSPDLVFVMDGWTSHKQLTAIHACVCMCPCMHALPMWHIGVFSIFVGVGAWFLCVGVFIGMIYWACEYANLNSIEQWNKYHMHIC